MAAAPGRGAAAGDAAAGACGGLGVRVVAGVSGGDRREASLETQRLAAAYGESVDDLAAVVREIEEVQRQAARERLDRLQAAASLAGERRERLLAIVRAHPELYERPRTQQVAGVKFGWRKKPGRVSLGKSALELVKSKLAHRADQLIRVREEIDKNALKALPARELAAIGATLTATTDEPLVEPARSDVERLAASLLRDATAEDAA